MKVVIRALGIMVLALAAGRCGAAEELKIKRFDVVPVDDKAILVDTATGDTWILERLPTSDNKSGYIWQRIPSPLEAKFPKDESEMQAISLEPLSLTADKDKTTLSATYDLLSLKIKAPPQMAVGDQTMLSLHIASDRAPVISKLSIQLPSSLQPLQATADYDRDKDLLVWQNVQVPRKIIVAYGVEVKAIQFDKEALVRCRATVDGNVYEVSKVVEIQQDFSSKELKASDEKSDDKSEK